jgi:glycosyltransferase involved in cell wall biosynthesis
VIANPVPIIPPDRRWRLEGCDRKTVLFVGRFDRHKGGDLVIDAFREIGAVSPEAELAFVGPDRGLRTDGGATQDLPSYLDAHLPAALRARARIWGPLPSQQIELLRRQAYVTVIASRYENCSLALAESLAFGCPTVASDVGGNPELLLSERTGLLFAPGKASDLAAKVLSLFAQPERAAEMGRRAAADMTERLSPEPIARATLDYYQSILRDRPAAAARRNPRRALYELTSLI